MKNAAKLVPHREALPEEPSAMSVADRINWHYRAANADWKSAQEHALQCGWELALQKARCGWGGWGKWIKENLEFSRDTADRLVAFYEARIGAERKRIGLALENDIRPEELEAACNGPDGQSVTAAMIDAGVVKHSPNWGGDRREAAAANGKTVGRPPKSEVVEQMRIDAWADRFVEESAEAVFEKGWHLRLDEGRRKKVLEIAKRIAEDLGKGRTGTPRQNPDAAGK